MGPSAEDHLRLKFPRLTFERFRITSPSTAEYNCIAWAALDEERWWWPAPTSYWPRGVPMDDSVTAFMKAYATIGYEVCDGEGLEEGFEKIVLYVKDGHVKHAARQVVSGKWTSKLGISFDIEHTIEGFVVRSMVRRPGS